MYKGLPRVSRGQLATIVERTVNQNCCFPEQVRCQIIARFRLHIVTVFRAQISGGARWELGGVGVWVGIETSTLSQRKNFNKAPAKALFSLVPVFKSGFPQISTEINFWWHKSKNRFSSYFAHR